MPESTEQTPRHQPDRHRYRDLLGPAAVLAVILALAHWGLNSLFKTHPEARPTGLRLAERPAAVDARRFAEIRSRKRAHLESFGWVDPQRQVAHIPIERAMEIVAREHATTIERRPSGSAPAEDQADAGGEP